MPDLGNRPLPLVPCSPVKAVIDSAALEALPSDFGSDNGVDARVLKRTRSSLRKTGNAKSLWDRLTDPQSLPFLVAAPKMVECCFCHHYVCTGEELICSVHGCGSCYHKECAKQVSGVSNLKKNKFKCPQHVCFICKKKMHLRCVRCTTAFHSKRAPWPEAVIPLKDHPGQAVCWRHPLIGAWIERSSLIFQQVTFQKYFVVCLFLLLTRNSKSTSLRKTWTIRWSHRHIYT